MTAFLATCGRIWERAGTACCAIFLTGLNVYIAQTMFHTGFTPYMGSIESSYMVISRWAAAHWRDLSWFPFWFSGTPFYQVYQPGYHLTVAALSRLAGWTIPRSFHFVAAAAYCLGPVTLFWLCRRTTGKRGFAFVAAAAYSLISPASFLVPAIRHDAGGLLHARRYQVLLSYGEGPHLAAMMLLPLALWALDGAVQKRRWPYIPLASALMAAMVLTNWPGTFALGIAVLAYALSRRGAERGIDWPAFLAVSALAYLLACPWITPSTLALVIRNAFQSDNTTAGFALSAPWALIALLVGGLEALFDRRRVTSWARFFVYFAVITGVVSLGAEAFEWRAMPQAKRFQLEFEMAAVTALAYGAAVLWRRMPRPVRILAIGVFLALGVAQTRTYRRQVKATTTRFDITSTIEYKMAQWFDANLQNRRVFAPGNVAYWMNMFTDVPQMEGCCEQGTPSQMYRMANYQIYSGAGAGARDAEITMLWLRAYGVDAIGISGPNSTEVFRPFNTPKKFEGVLPAAWRDGDNAVYPMPWKNQGLAHAIDRSALVARAPESGLDTAPLERLARAMDATPPAEFRWSNVHEAAVDADLAPGQVIFLQVTYNRGWRALENGVERAIVPDALGLMAVDPGHAGHAHIRLVYSAGAEAVAARTAQLAGLLILAIWTLLARGREKRQAHPSGKTAGAQDESRSR